ncbi:endothelin-converting protein [Tamlana nanhaiensis]|uniref:Endothelin-converting protein n=1 Tax=Neotamlana nanhaiensis TaxID=1382798 RepID=A0A0D7VWQ8_9FLAO|nr:M13 family metallopeptidase [Tamlana nanhaiensis]KJD31300.1 endothelin-converting protein [Tamlana nanhaiensis]
MKKYSKLLILASICSLSSLTSCKTETKKEAEESAPGIDLTLMDTSVKPSEDFFRYVNGKWFDTTQIPDDQTTWGSFNALRKSTDADALTILKAAMGDNADLKKINVVPGSDQDKAVKLYKTIMDTVSRNQQGIAPIQSYLDKINAINNISDLQDYLIEMEPKGGAGFISFYVRSHTKNSDINAAYLSSGRLGLPDRDYYVKDDEDSKDKREKYVAHITRMLQFLGDGEDKASEEAQQILNFETRLAEPMMDKVDRRDARKRYNPRSIAELQNMIPAINWKQYFNGIGVKQIDTIIVSDVKYTKALQNILTENNVDDWKAYLRWSLFNSAAGALSTEIETANWEFYSKTLRGAKKQRPRDERALLTVNGMVGEALGKLYVDEKFPPEAKAKAEKMIANVIKAFENRINSLSWMTDETKAKAIEKLLALNVKIAYPDKWKDYSELEIEDSENGGSYYQNRLNASAWSHKKNLEDLGNPVDKSRWGMAPQTVNAYFNPAFNEIVFPAAILQPPFYNYLADDAVNYGGIGAVIGHEISHCFDDSGARYDKNGNLNNWWTDEDLEEFEALGKALADQYSAIEILPETFINGPFTLGENIGDLGGVTAAYEALQLSMKENGRPENIDGFTPEQRFFMSWATVWRTKMRESALKNRIKTDPHSPGMTRAVQPLKNIDAFYEAFNIKEGDNMYIKPEDRVKIW